MAKTLLFNKIDFQLEKHESMANAKSLNIQFFIHLQQTIAKQIQDCQQHIRVKLFSSYSHQNIALSDWLNLTDSPV